MLRTADRPHLPSRRPADHRHTRRAHAEEALTHRGRFRAWSRGRWRMYTSLISDTSPIYPLAIHVGHSLFCITSFREWRTGQTKDEPSWMHNLVCSYFCFGFGAWPLFSCRRALAPVFCCSFSFADNLLATSQAAPPRRTTSSMPIRRWVFALRASPPVPRAPDAHAAPPVPSRLCR